MSNLPGTRDYASIFLSGRPLLDVRAPVEFSQGAFPTATNLPLLNDHERERIGICYKQHGQQAAIALGHELVSGPVRETRLHGWQQFVRQHPDALLYCFRGGLRSSTVQQWLHETGTDIPLVEGGYKALRRFLINTLETSAATLPWMIIAGATGTGKTRIIQALPRAIDLEAAANHKGSSFGRPIHSQPSQIDFENRIAIDCLHRAQRPGTVFLEDESHLIGRCAIPLALRQAMGQAPRVLVEETRESRAQVILQEYVIGQRLAYRQAFGDDDGDSRYRDALLDSLHRIRRRLGGVLYQEIASTLAQAIATQLQTGALTGHLDWILALLEHYYDPMYDYQLSRQAGPIVFRGNREAVLAWCLAQTPEKPSC